MQVPLADPSMQTALAHFSHMWTRSFAGFLADAEAGDYIVFAPELLPSSINYARRFCSPDGTWIEDSDRWQDAPSLVQIARECFSAAERLLTA